MENKPINPNQTIFEQLKKMDENNHEYWTARDLSKVLEYSEYRHFKPVIDRAKEACKNSGYDISHHFEDILDMIELGKGARRGIENIKMSRYACYLIVQNADPGKEIVALGQTYFAVQTRLQEIRRLQAFQIPTISRTPSVWLSNDISVVNHKMIAHQNSVN
jgi:DNA-damage-inducible protein D